LITVLHRDLPNGRKKRRKKRRKSRGRGKGVKGRRARRKQRENARRGRAKRPVCVVLFYLNEAVYTGKAAGAVLSGFIGN